MNLLRLILLIPCGLAYAQTCQYQTLSFPSGAIQVFKNGVLQRQGADFNYIRPAGKLPSINPLAYAAGDHFTIIFPHKVTLTNTVGGVSVPYVTYQNYIENWTCATGNTGPAPWIPDTCTFASPPAAPADGQTCIFLDADQFKSCTGATGGRPSGWETCRWSRDLGVWKATSAPVESSLFPFTASTARLIECTGGLVPVSSINAGVPSVELPIFSVDGSVRWDHVMVAENEKFLPDIGLRVSMGRPGTDDDEMLLQVPLGKMSDLSVPWTSRPSPPQLSGTYSVVLAFTVADGHLLQELTAGTVYWEACGYRVGPLVGVAPPHLAALESCSGSGVVNDPDGKPVSTWDCSGQWRASVVLRDNASMITLVGVEAPWSETANMGGKWTAR